MHSYNNKFHSYFSVSMI